MARIVTIEERRALASYEEHCRDNGITPDDQERTQFVESWLGAAAEHRIAGVEAQREDDKEESEFWMDGIESSDSPALSAELQADFLAARARDYGPEDAATYDQRVGDGADMLRDLEPTQQQTPPTARDTQDDPGNGLLRRIGTDFNILRMAVGNASIPLFQLRNDEHATSPEEPTTYAEVYDVVRDLETRVAEYSEKTIRLLNVAEAEVKRLAQAFIERASPGEISDHGYRRIIDHPPEEPSPHYGSQLANMFRDIANPPDFIRDRPTYEQQLDESARTAAYRTPDKGRDGPDR